MEFARVDALHEKLKAIRSLNEAERNRLRDEFMIENTYDSNAIEGNTLTLRETALILLEGLTISEKPIKDHLEAIGHRDAFEYILSLAGAEIELSERVIKEIHALVLMNDAANRGKYRNVPVTILGAAHNPPQPYLVPVQMEQLISDYRNLKNEKHLIEAVCEFHLRFEGIHPFIDGNGRTGRLLLNLELMKGGLLPVNIKYADRLKYYDCFDRYYTENYSAKAFIDLVSDYELEELEKRIKISEGC